MRALRYPDLVELGLVANWQTLNRWIAKEGFPPGHMCGRRRIWTEREVFAWIESRQAKNPAMLKGYAKKTFEAKRARLEAVEANARLEGADV